MGTTDYKAIVKLGEGGSAVVYLGVAVGAGGFHKLVVLKTLKPNLLSDPEQHRMFLNEARLSARLNHANIVQVYEISIQLDRPYIVMEYLEGKPVSHIRTVARGSATEALQLRILCDALAGLHFSHELCDFDGTPLRLVHRDFTPQNVFVTYDGRVKVLDFGIARIGDQPVSAEAGILRGKLRYMAPEQVLGGIVDHRADVFAAGVMAWEAAAGGKMWRDMATPAIIQSIAAGSIPSLRHANPQVDRRLETIIMRALAIEPSQRYATALALQTEIENYLDSTGIAWSQRQLASFMADHFSEDLKRTQSTIEKYVGQLSLTEDTTNIPVELLALRLPPEPEDSESGPESAQAHTVAVPPKRRWQYALAAAVLCLTAISLAVGVARQMPLQKPVVATEQASRPEKKSTRADVSLAATPDSAKLFLDGIPLPSNPHRAFFQVDRTPHTVRAEAMDFVPREVVVMFDRDANVTIDLERSPDRQGTDEVPPDSSAKAKRRLRLPHSPASTARPSLGPVAPPTQPAKPDCSPAFRIDERGVKRYKPECL